MNGDLSVASFWKPEGYVEYKKDEFSKIKYFIEDNDLAPRLDLQLLDKETMKVGDVVTRCFFLDSGFHRVYYRDKSNGKLLYMLHFQ